MTVSLHEAWRRFWKTPIGKARLARVAFLQRKTGTIRDDWHLTMAIAHYYGIAPSSFAGPNDAYTLCEKCWQTWENAIALAQHDGTLDTGLQELAWRKLEDCLGGRGCPSPQERDIQTRFRRENYARTNQCDDECINELRIYADFLYQCLVSPHDPGCQDKPTSMLGAIAAMFDYGAKNFPQLSSRELSDAVTYVLVGASGIDTVLDASKNPDARHDLVRGPSTGFHLD